MLAASLGSEEEFYISDADHIFMGKGDGHQAGYSVSSAGDVDGDGLADLLIGAWKYNTAYLVLGESLSGVSSTELSTAGFSFVGEVHDDCAGNAVAGAGDLNGDGLDDLLVGAIYGNAGGTAPDGGQVHILISDL